jgi:Holliday junction resolvase RusA-like endonuclease
MKRTLIIEGSLPNLNDYTKACRSNRYAGANMKQNAERIISAYIQQQLKNVHFDGTVILAFRWFEPNRKRDLDNICFAKKFILDALVKNGTIKTDNWQGVAGFTDQFFVDKAKPRIEVDIELKEGDANG